MPTQMTFSCHLPIDYIDRKTMSNNLIIYCSLSTLIERQWAINYQIIASRKGKRFWISAGVYGVLHSHTQNLLRFFYFFINELCCAKSLLDQPYPNSTSNNDWSKHRKDFRRVQNYSNVFRPLRFLPKRTKIPPIFIPSNLSR